MAYSAQKLDPFSLKMMAEVVREHDEALKTPNHEGGFCCQVAEQYKVRMAAHQELVAAEKAVRQEDPEAFARPLSDPQARYIVSLYKKCPAHLLAPGQRVQAEKVVKHEEISFEDAKSLIEAMKSVVDGPERPKDSAAVRYATAAQVGFLKKLLSSREHDEKVDVTALEMLPLSVASDMISRLKAAPYKGQEKSQKRYIPEEGLYEVDGVVYKVQKAKATGSDNTYAKVMDKETGEFSYVGQKPFDILTEDKKMSREEAGKYGRLYGHCIRCGRTLTDDFSITNGLGKVCYAKMGG